jgi:acetyl esterase
MDHRLADRALHAALSLPDAVFTALAGRRRTIDGQRLSPRLQFLAGRGEHALAALADPPTAGQLAFFERLQRAAALDHLRDADWRDLTVRGGGDGRRARLYEPAGLSEAPGLVVFVHGGGWQVGSLDAYDGLCAFLAKTARVKVLALDYRLSWEARFPAAFDDVLAGFVDAVDRAEELGVDRDRVAIVGDSAGGNLASAVALHLATDARHRPKLAGLIYPAVDHDLDRYESADLFKAPLTPEIVHRDIRRYAPREADHRDPRAAVMAASDLSRMPPTYIATAGMDVLRDQGEAFGERLLDSGVEVDVRRFSNLPHGFFGLFVDPEARAATGEIAVAIGERLRIRRPHESADLGFRHAAKGRARPDPEGMFARWTTSATRAPGSGSWSPPWRRSRSSRW